MIWNEIRELTRLGLPMVGTQFFIMAMGFLDTAMAGHYASVDLAGVALGGNILWPVFMLLAGLTMALTPMVAHFRGEGKVHQLGGLVRQGIWLALFSSAIIIAIITHAGPVFDFFEIDPTASDIADRYLKAAAWGIPGVMAYVTLRYVCEGLGHTVEPMLIAGSSLLINGTLNYILIYGKLGFPEMGGEGCGWATAITMWCELVLMLFLISRPWFRETGLLSRFEWLHFDNLLSIIKVGLPIGLTSFIGMAVFSVVAFFIGSIGVTALAAHSIAGNINWATFVIPMSLGSAASIRVGYFVGAGDFAYARQVSKTAFQISLVYALFTSILLISGRHLITAIYSNDLIVLEVASSLLIIVAIYQIVDCTQATMIGSLRGYKDTRVPMVYSLIGYWIFALPIGAVLGFGYISEPWGVYGFWTGMALGLFFVCMLVGRRLYQTSHDDERIRAFAAI
ncbi:MAG: MATE family efflux transporter [Gammaproteobacteria bacterium]|nr:MATE family efflux transporter [Gammaproteobacteria bacterium]